MLKRINHIAIVTPNLEESLKVYQQTLGATVSEPKILPDHGVKVAFVEFAEGATKTEFLEPLDEHAPIAKFLQKNPKGGLHHICYDVSRFDDAVKKATDSGARIVGDIKIGAHGKRVVFLHPADTNGVLTELQEMDDE